MFHDAGFSQRLAALDHAGAHRRDHDRPRPHRPAAHPRHLTPRRRAAPLDPAAAAPDMCPAMCGRFLNRLPPAEIARLFATGNVVPNYPARFNIARAETLATLPAFRDAFQRRRCLIPAGGFYEWQKDGKTRTPYVVMPADAPLFAFAGLWENWRDPSTRAQGADAPWVRSCTIVTAEPNALLAPIHSRMPVILPREAWAPWLGETPADAAALQALLTPYPAERMRLYPVAPRVNSVKNDAPSLLEPASPQSGDR